MKKRKKKKKSFCLQLPLPNPQKMKQNSSYPSQFQNSKNDSQFLVISQSSPYLHTITTKIPPFHHILLKK